MTLTTAGQTLQRHAQRILGYVDHLAADLSDYASALVGVVRLWANTSAVTQFLPTDIAAFVQANRGIRIELEEEDSSKVVMAVRDGRADHARPAGCYVDLRSIDHDMPSICGGRRAAPAKLLKRWTSNRARLERALPAKRVSDIGRPAARQR